MTLITPRLQIALLGLWVGVAGLFSFGVAPVAFSVLPTSQLAGAVVSNVLAGVEIIGICVGLLFLVLSLASGRQKRLNAFDLIVIVLLILSMGASRFAVSPRLHQIREQFGDRLAGLPADDAIRLSFDFLHKCSVGLLAFGLFSALVLLAVLIWRESAK